MDFKSFCKFLQCVKDTKGITEKAKLVEKEFLKYNELFQTVKSNETIFDVIRLMVPKLDRDRSSYNMKESKIARALIKMLDLPEGNDKTLLTKSYLSGGNCDFAEIVYSVIRKYIASYTSKLTINELNHYLDDITNRKSDRETEQILMKIFKNSSPEDAKWIIRIILKDLKLGIDANNILKCFHKDAVDFYLSNTNLKKVCETLTSPDIKLHEIEIKVFDAFRPMLSKRIDSTTFRKCIKENQTYYVENKFDGERFQLHMQTNEFMYFSRNGFDYTTQFGADYNSGIFTPKLRNVFNTNTHNIILDGEMMLFNKETQTFGSKGMTMDVKKLVEEKKYAPCFCVYDILLLNNEILTNKPFHERIEILRKVIVQEKIGIIIVSQYKKVHNRKEVIEELNAAVNKEDEGIILKEPNSIYKYSDRNSGWYKMKLDYFNDVMNDMDVILMGGTYSSYTSNKITKFIVGVRSGTTETGKPLYLAFGRVGSGFSAPQIHMLNNKLKTEGFPFEKYEENKNQQLLFGQEKPHYFIEPKNSLIFLIRATELIHSDNSFRTPYTLRFPRVLSIRYDKPVDECMTINDVLNLCQQNKAVIKLNKRNIELEEILHSHVRQKKVRKIAVAKINEISNISEALNGLTIYVLNGNEDKSKEDYENIIRRTGGKVLYKIDKTIDIVLVGCYNEKVANLISNNPKYDIISSNWLERVVKEGEQVLYENKDIHYIGWSFANSLAEELDMYGDSYIQNATEESLQRSFRIIKDRKEIHYEDNESIQSLFPTRCKFLQFCAYFDKYETINDCKSKIIYDSLLDQMEFKYYNGTIKETIDFDTNLIIFNGGTDRKEFLINYLQSIQRQDIKIEPPAFLSDQ